MSRAKDATRARLTEELTDPLSRLGFDLEAVELNQAGRRALLRVAVDKDGGVTLDDVAEADRAISAVLDDSDVMGEAPFTLEVTSRGVDRPLTLPRHWRRNLDRLVTVRLNDDTEVTGRITASTDDTATLDVGGAPREVALADVEKAVVQIEFNRRRADEED